ncbi:MAG: PH domain-containing protein [Planctomycetota bacterium]|jgi:hypothetical protein
MTTVPDNVEVEFSWQAHPAAERIGAALVGSLIVVAASGAIYASFQSIEWSVLALAVLVLSLNRFYFRSRFHIDPDGITARFPLRSQRCRWADIRRFMVDDHGGYLSTRAKRSWLDAYRGLHILFGRQRPTVIEQIRTHLTKESGR